jgi:hypothetical protein
VAEVTHRAIASLVILVTLASGLPATAAPPPQSRIIEVEGTAFHITLADGHVLAQDQLPGTIIAFGNGSGRQRFVRIDSAAPDPKDKGGEVMLYTLSEQDPTSGEWRNLCRPDAEQNRLGFPLSGAFTSDGRYVAEPNRMLITCTGGAEGKCVRLGYKPWGKAPDGTSLFAAYNACVRLVRADYAGDGRGTTRNGQPIDIYDSLGINSPDGDAPYEFEAGFTADGATCVHHVRVRENATLAGIEAASSRLKGRIGAICDEAFARAAGAILFVRSPP